MFPTMLRVRQSLARPRVADIPGTVARSLQAASLAIKPGDSVGVGAGSRGIANIDVVVGATVQYLRDLGARPFVFPAMGSHGGGRPRASFRCSSTTASPRPRWAVPCGPPWTSCRWARLSGCRCGWIATPPRSAWSIGLTPPEQARVVRIKNTLMLGELELSGRSPPPAPSAAISPSSAKRHSASTRPGA